MLEYLMNMHMRSLLRAITTWSVWRVGLSFWGYFIWWKGLINPEGGREWLYGIEPAIEGARAGLIDIWMRWDTVHYLRIIQDGYGPDERSAFFPLYPFIGKAFGFVLAGNNLLGLLLVSNLAAIGCFYLIDSLEQIEDYKVKSHPVVSNLIFYPAAFFLIVAYPQSLVLLFSLAAYLAQKKNLLLLSFILGIVAGLTHSTALALTILLIANALADKRIRKIKFITAFGPVLGIVIFMAWRMQAGYPMYQELQWTMSNRSIGFGIDLEGVMTPGVWLLRGWPNLLAFFMGVGSVLWAYRNHKLEWAAYEAALLMIPVMSAPSFEPFDGLARYALIGFPVFFALSTWISNGWWRLILFALAIGGNLYLSGLFIMWGFIG